MPTLYDLPLATLSGSPTSLADYKGKVLLIVNVASKCGLTPQYTALEALYRRFKDKGLVVLGFPANDFAEQEPGSNDDIAKFCSIDYPVTFPIFSKIAVNGPEQHPVYTMLTSLMPQHQADGADFRDNLDNYLSGENLPPTLPLPAVLWNFEKFLIGRDGSALARFSPDMKPDDPRIVAAIETALAQ
ncbi:MAG: glutathione peroxidase [Acidobacteriota bacterium]|nr:glutathione peroxidase [Acidobacteriota bacterium]